MLAHGFGKPKKRSEAIAVLKEIARDTIQLKGTTNYFVGGVFICELKGVTYMYSFYDYKSAMEIRLLAQIYVTIKDMYSPYYTECLKLLTGELDATTFRSAIS